MDLWTKVKDVTFDEYISEILPKTTKRKTRTKILEADSVRIKKVEAKLNAGDVRGAIRILSSNDSIAPVNLDNYVRLLEKHPAPGLEIVDVDDYELTPIEPVTASEITIAISNFPNGSAGGMDGLKPQHLKDMIHMSIGEHGTKLKQSLCSFSDLCLNGKLPSFIIPILYGANLCGISKKNGSVRPIAIGCTLRRLVSKIACARIYEKIGFSFAQGN